MAQNSSSPSGASCGLNPKLAATLAYVCAPFGGILFLLIEKNDKTVKLHAWHSIVFGCAAIGLSVVERLITSILMKVSLAMVAVFGLINLVIGLGLFVLWILLMVKAYQGSIFEIPYLTKIAREQADK